MKKLLNKLKFSNAPSKFGTFGGVFTPDVLTILGVIMYLRLGWVVGNAGLLGAIAIIILAKLITIATGLSMSSITTNIKIGPGGAYSIISKSLGLEAGGSVGIPLYVAQTLSAALYIVGFTEGWLVIFPDHNPALIGGITWAVLLTISYVSTLFAIRIQYIILGIIGLSIISFFMTPAPKVETVNLIGAFEDAGFWQVFAVFFPAVTGIMAGANLSGDLKDPRKAIPVGTMGAIGVTLIVYIGIAIVCAYFIPSDILRDNQMVMVDYSFFGQLVLLGILAATFSSALGSIIGAPRILQALSEQQSVPFYKIFALKSENNEPRNAIIFTSLLILASLLVGSLDALASLITMFFLITYGMLNLVVFIQQSMKIISFRPTFKIPRFIPLIGGLGCIAIMFLIDPVFSIVAIVIIIGLYVWLTRKGLAANWGDIRGGMFLYMAERASRIAANFPRHQISWKPDILLPVEDPALWAGPLLFIKNITYPSGTIYAYSVKEENIEETKSSLDNLMQPLRQQELLINSAVIEDKDFLHGSKIVIQTLRAAAMRPNALFLTLGSDPKNDIKISRLVNYAYQNELGILILRQHPRIAFGLQKDVNLWLRDKSPNWHLAVLITLQLQLNWNGKINLVSVAENDKHKKKINKYMQLLSDQTRLPALTEFHILTGNFLEALKNAPRADVNIFGLADELDMNFMRDVPELTNSSCLFVKDSGHENALA